MSTNSSSSARTTDLKRFYSLSRFSHERVYGSPLLRQEKLPQLCINPTTPIPPDLQGQSIRVDLTARLVFVG
jgi:hypothetical protein